MLRCRRPGRRSGGSRAAAWLILATFLQAGSGDAAAAGTISGLVTNEAGEPLAQIAVFLHPASDEDGESGELVTDDSGEYRFDGLEAGSYKVRFADCYGQRCSYVGEWYDDAATFESADEVVVADGGETRGIDAELAEGGRISGRVTGENGEALYFICVFVADAAGNAVAGGLTDEAGAYQTAPVPTGDYRVGFFDCQWILDLFEEPDFGFGGDDDPWCTDERPYVTEWYDDRPDFESADAVGVVAPLETTGIDAALARMPAADVVVTDLAAETLPGAAGDETASTERRIHVAVENAAAATPSPGAELEVTVCGATLGCTSVGRSSLEDLAPGDARQLAFDWNALDTATVGDVTVTARASLRNDAECSNNEASVGDAVLVGGAGVGASLIEER